MLSTAQMASMTAQQEAALPDLCNISRPQKTANSIGSVDSTGLTSVEVDTPCRIVPGQMNTAFGQQSRPVEINHYTIRVPLGTNVLDRDMLEHEESGQWFRVERVRTSQSYDTVLTLECEYIS